MGWRGDIILFQGEVKTGRYSSHKHYMNQSNKYTYLGRYLYI